jgi:hypothetical protein
MHKNDRIIILLGLFITVIAITGAAVFGESKLMEAEDEGILDYHLWPITTSVGKTITGERINENSDELITINDINETHVTAVHFELHWEDEDNLKDAGVYKVNNKPDYFNFTIITPWEETIDSDTAASSYGGAGQLLVDVSVPDEPGATTGDWRITIHCGDCGDQVLIGPSGEERATVEEDTGNNWLLLYYFEFHTNN